jgi:hypothetical protein
MVVLLPTEADNNLSWHTKSRLSPSLCTPGHRLDQLMPWTSAGSIGTDQAA